MINSAVSTNHTIFVKINMLNKIRNIRVSDNNLTFSPQIFYLKSLISKLVFVLQHFSIKFVAIVKSKVSLSLLKILSSIKILKVGTAMPS